MSATDGLYIVQIPANSSGAEVDTGLFQQVGTGYFVSADYALAGPIVADPTNTLQLDIIVAAPVGGATTFRKIFTANVAQGVISLLGAAAIAGSTVVPEGTLLGSGFGWSIPTASDEHSFASTPTGTASDPGGSLSVVFAGHFH